MEEESRISLDQASPCNVEEGIEDRNFTNSHSARVRAGGTTSSTNSSSDSCSNGWYQPSKTERTVATSSSLSGSMSGCAEPQINTDSPSSSSSLSTHSITAMTENSLFSSMFENKNTLPRPQPHRRRKRRLDSFFWTVAAIAAVTFIATLSRQHSSLISDGGLDLETASAFHSSSGRHLLQNDADSEDTDYDDNETQTSNDNPECEDDKYYKENKTAEEVCAKLTKCTQKKQAQCCDEYKDASKNSGDDPLFPPDLFSKEQLKGGAIILYIIGIIYMFYALALVCDEFFVPSLDVITEKLEITPDVAGATFMAAGGSAPELFTSIIGVFIAQSDVGIGTIVGSAVFNILFVIAACAFAAKEALKLTAWPLIRDVFFYSVSLVLLVAFFIDNKIEWWEALILFLWYFSYVGFMKFNEDVEDKLRSCLGLAEADRSDDMKGVTLRQAANRKGLFHLMNETINPGVLHGGHGKGPKGNPEGHEVEMQPLNPAELKSADGDVEKPAVLGPACSEGGLNKLSSNQTMILGGGQTAGEAGIVKLKTHLAGSQATDVSVAPSNGATSKEMDEMGAPKDNGDADGGSSKQHNNQSFPSQSVKPVEGGDDDDEEGEEPIDMAFPKDKGWKAILIYLVSLPIMAPLYFTLPDTKNEKRKKWFVVTFIGSILWIAVFSYLMVWWATITGQILGIPDVVMGLTFLAAGTSVPDLITSVLVAQKGKGDMAVSSSVGSNIFDVCVGLPLPWLLYCAANQSSVNVSSEGIGCSIGLLFIMLVLVFLSILIFKWQMTKGMGVMMMILYFVFVIVTLGFTDMTCWYPCPFDSKKACPNCAQYTLAK